MQAPVEAEASTTLTLLGFGINVGNPTETPPNQWEDTNGQPMTLNAFLNAVTPATTNAAGSVPGTLVKVTFEPGASGTVRQAELED